MDSSWNIGSIGIGGPPLRGPSSSRLLAEPPLSPPVSAGAVPTASAQPLEPTAPLAPPPPAAEAPASVDSTAPAVRPASSLESLLMRFRLITSDQLDEALREQRATGRDVGAIVVERGWVNEDQLARLLSYAPAFSPPAEPAESPLQFDEQPASQPDPEPAPASAATEDLVSHEIAAEPEQHATSEPALEPEPAPEPESHAAAAEADVRGEAPQPVELSPVHPLLSGSFELPPALELVESEPAAEVAQSLEPAAEAAPIPEPATEPARDPAAEANPEAEAQGVEHAAVVVEPVASGPVLEAAPVELAPLAPVVPAVEPVVPPVDHVEAPSAPQPELEPEPVAAPQPPAAAPEPQTVRFVDPSPIETIARVFVRLSNGERVEAGSFDDVATAKARAEEVVREVSNGSETWPFFGGRYIRPDVVVSVDVDATVVRYA